MLSYKISTKRLFNAIKGEIYLLVTFFSGGGGSFKHLTFIVEINMLSLCA